MELITFGDRTFRRMIESRLIQDRIDQLAQQISQDYKDNDVCIVGVMTGCYRFLADLSSRLTINPQITSIKIRSYDGTTRKKIINDFILDFDIEKKHVVIIEDIVDSGITIDYLTNKLNKLNPKSIDIASLFLKPDSVHDDLKNKINVKYCGFEIPNDFIIGYGLDVDGWGRNLNDVYCLEK